MSGDDPTMLLILAIVALAWRVLGIGDLIRHRPRRRRPYDPSTRPWGKGW
jgi:hypothetical protein